MIRNWYSKLKRMRLYRAFLKHRVWTAKMILSTHIFYCFPLGSVGFVWVFLPLKAATAIFVALFSGSDWLNPAMVLLHVLFFITLAPMMARFVKDLFRGYFAGMFAVFGRKTAAHTFLRNVEKELEEWEHQYA